MDWPKPTFSRTKYRRLKPIFDSGPPELVAGVMALCVLFEDLHLELSELSEDGDPYRNLYFIRRSIATLREFADAIIRLEGLAGFDVLRKSFSQQQRGIWNSAVAYLRKEKQLIFDERNAYGAHVSHGSVQKGLEGLDYGEEGGLEIHFVERLPGGQRIGTRFRFAGIIVASMITARKKPDQKAKEYVRGLWGTVAAAYEKATDCVFLITDVYLASRFGF